METFQKIEVRREYLKRFVDNCPAALLFRGRAGVGKFVTACEVGKQITGGTLYVHVYETAPSIDQVRALKKQAMIIPRSKIGKQVFVLQIDDLGIGAANALLKVLEEVPSPTHFILVASLDTMLTISSRCYIVNFAPYSESQLQSILEGRGLLCEEAIRLSRMSEGTLKLALEGEGEGEKKQAFVDAVRYLSKGNRELFIKQSGRFTPEQVLFVDRWFASILLYKRTGLQRDFVRDDYCGYEKFTNQRIEFIYRKLKAVRKPTLKLLLLAILLAE